ncbi:hypothetical protein R0131_09625 [Clostridium sp. AL.422]|uniref:hypothetical protein n=1 Tax=Clostridium TaxID=1485 RepID=UPI00293DDF32|nr:MULTISPECIES: hypothetical protein [unclassified Clostridium]MDV4151097.1 hypothetical protein [Clostridium sp. AL.422]
MGTMGSERRNLEQLRAFFVVGLVMGLIGNISYFLKYNEISIEFFDSIDINGLTIMMTFSVLILGIFSIGNIKLEVNEEMIIDIKRKTIIYKIIFILFAIYTIAISIIFKDLLLIRLEMLIEIILIILYINERKIKSIQLMDIQLRWKRDFDYPGSLNKESNVFWRMKVRFFPHVKVKWNDRIHRIRKYNILILAIFLVGRFELATVLFLFIFIPEVIYLIEIIFCLYTKTSGICTGIIDVTSSKSRIPVYKVYITNYKLEEEITFKVRNYCYIQERDEVVVVHGAISKRVIEVQGVRMDFI